jgi:Fur family ferric uptake transcriptional regulator
VTSTAKESRVGAAAADRSRAGDVSHPASAVRDGEGWIERAEAKLAGAGHKRGGARRAVLELLDAQPCARTAHEIEDALRVAERSVSRASVYRILDELEGLRLVQRVETGQAMVRYERAGEHDEHHHHLVCDGCGLVMPFSDEALEQAISSLSRRVPLTVSEHEIVLRGACSECSE